MNRKIVNFPNLDAIRFFAFFSVFTSHLFFFKPDIDETWFGLAGRVFLQNGDLGVTLFFVLSGFLITYLLQQEKNDMGRIDIRHFYVRRVLRIWPLYFLNILVGVTVIPLLANHPAVTSLGHGPLLSLERISVPHYLAFIGNFDFGSMEGSRNILIGILWSVCVEEQFYLLWPLIISALDGRRLTVALIAIIIGATAYRMLFARSYGAVHYFTFSCISDLAIGALSAHAIRNSRRFHQAVTDLRSFQVVSIYFLLVLMLFIRRANVDISPLNALGRGFFPVVFSVLFAAVILEQNYSRNSPFKLGRLDHLSEFGRYTYFAYCFHYHVFLLIVLGTYWVRGSVASGSDGLVVVVQIVLGYSLVFLIGKLSYRHVEKPFMDLKSRFAYIIRPEGAGAAHKPIERDSSGTGQG